MNFEQWAAENLEPDQSPYSAAKAAWEFQEKQKAGVVGARVSACHVRPDQPPLVIDRKVT